MSLKKVHGLGQSASGGSQTVTTEPFSGQGNRLGGDSSQAQGSSNAKAPKPVKLQDHFVEEHYDDVIKQLDVNSLTRLFGLLNGLTYEDIGKIIQPVGGKDVFEDTAKVLNYWIKKMKENATRQAIIHGLEESVLNAAKDNLKEHWKELKTKCVPEDSQTIIMEGQLAWNDLYKMFLNSGLRDFEIQIHVQSDNVQMNAIKVFKAWTGVKPRPTIKQLFDNLVEAGNPNAVQEIGEKWKIPLDDMKAYYL